MALIKTKSLIPQAYQVLVEKATEHPFSGEYNDNQPAGTYLCRQCGLALFRSQAKFHSGCGWPSFEQAIDDHLQSIPDKDGHRTEIVCQRCQGHLGHVFFGEKFTEKNTRHCVNSLSLDFVEDSQVVDTQEAILGAGCFWGVDYYFKKLAGVLKVDVGYCGGSVDFPDYQQVCRGDTGHIEAVRVIYDSQKLSYQKVIEYFFEIHDFTQKNGQGPDIGEQYLSAIFYYDQKQQQFAKQTITRLEKQGYQVATQLRAMATFWPAEDYHQNYYGKTGKSPYCHGYKKIF